MKKWLFFFCITSAFATDLTVSTTNDSGAGSLREAITTINTGAGTYNVIFTVDGNFLLSSSLPPLNFSTAGALLSSTVNFNTTLQPITINGADLYSTFFVASGTVNFNSMTIINGLSQGGAGAAGGGGGLGAGGAIFVNENAAVTATDCTFSSNSAVGGAGGSAATSGGGGGGGMLQGTGGSPVNGGGGGAGLAVAGNSAIGGTGGSGGGANGGGGGASGATGTTGTNASGTGGGGGGGGQGTAGNGGAGGNGGDFGGGGGGGTGTANGGNGGTGGWGAGGGGGGAGSTNGTGGTAGFGGGAGATFGSPGSSGSAYGGGIFVRETGLLTIQNSTSSTNLTSNTAATGGGDLYIDIGVNAIFAPGANLTFSLGTLAGPGSLTMSGNGTLALVGSLNYTGDTTVSSGTFDISNAVAGFGLVPVYNLSGNGTIYLGTNNIFITENTSTIFTGTITGEGSLFTAGTQTLTLTAANTYTVGTFITETSTLSLVSNASLNPTAPLSLTSSGSTFDIGGIVSSTQVGNLQGVSGSIINLETKTLLAGGSGNTTFSGSITGTGGNFTKTGTGTLTFASAISSDFSTTVANGTLILSANLTSSPVTIQNGGTLQGTGNITGNIEVQSGGILSPGTLTTHPTYTGNLTLDPGGILAVEVNPTQSTQLTLTGTATLTGSILDVTVDSATYSSSQTYLILNAASLGGTQFGSITGTSGFSKTLQYTATNVYLTLSQLYFPTHGCGSPDDQALFDYINTLLPNNFTYINIFGDLLEESCQQQIAANKTISPASNTASTYSNMISTFQMNQLISSHFSNTRLLHLLSTPTESLSYLSQRSDLPPTWLTQMSKQFQNSLWGTGFGNLLHEKASPNLSAFNIATRGYFIGYDSFGSSDGFLGTGFGYSDSNINQADNTNSSVHSILLTFYGTGVFRGFFYEGALLGSYNRIATQRHIHFTGFDATAIGAHDNWQFSPHFGCGYDAAFDWGYMETYLTLDFVANWETSYQETKAGSLDLNVKPRTSSMLRSELGLNAFQKWEFKSGLLMITETAAYVNRAPIQEGPITSSFIGAPGSFQVTAFHRMENLFSPKLQGYFQTNDNFFAVFDYDGEFGTQSTLNQIRVTFGKYF